MKVLAQVCFGRRIRQYHMENDRPVGVIMDLGTFDLTRDILTVLQP